MPRLRVSPHAAADVEAIAAYIRRDRPAAAARVGANLYKTFEFLANHPQAGESRDDIRPGIRLFVPGPPASWYLIFFQFRKAQSIVEIAAVVDSSRDWQSLIGHGES